MHETMTNPLLHPENDGSGNPACAGLTFSREPAEDGRFTVGEAAPREELARRPLDETEICDPVKLRSKSSAFTCFRDI